MNFDVFILLRHFPLLDQNIWRIPLKQPLDIGRMQQVILFIFIQVQYKQSLILKIC